MTQHIERADEAQWIEWARGIVTNELLVVDLSNRAWQASLGLMMSALSEYDNLGLILVPKGPHLAMHWINNTAPGCTVSCIPIAQEDLVPLQARVDTMLAILFPDQARDTQ